MQSLKAAMVTRKERRDHRRQQKPDFELVHESKVIWEHLRQHKKSPGRTLAMEEIMCVAQGHFKEVRYWATLRR